MAGFAYVAGYAVLIVLATIGAVFAPQAIAPGAPKWLFAVIDGTLMVGGAVLVTWLMRVKLNKLPWAGMALPAPQGVPLLLGFSSGAMLLLLVLWLQHELGWLNVSGVDTMARAAPRLALGLLPSLAVGVSEELTFRGYIFQTLGERMPVWAAAGFSAAIFALFHLTLGGFGLGFVVSAICVALLFTILRVATGSLWCAIGFHCAWDWVQTYVVGVAHVGQQGQDSALVRVSQSGPILWVGKAPAIEGGLIYGLAMVIALALAISYAARRKRMPQWSRRLALDGGAI